MKSKTPDQKMKMKKKDTPRKSPTNKVEIIEMDTSKLKTPKTPKLPMSSTPKIFQTQDDSEDEKTEIKILKKHKTPQSQTPNISKIKTPKMETEFPTPKIKKMKTPQPEKSQNMEMEFPTPKIKKVKTPKVEVKTPKMEIMNSTPKIEKVRTPKTRDTPKAEKVKRSKSPNMETQTPKLEKVRTPKTPTLEKSRPPKTPIAEIEDKNTESVKKLKRKRKELRKDEEDEDSDASPKKKDKKNKNKENTASERNTNNGNQEKNFKDNVKNLITIFVAPLDSDTRSETVRDFFMQHGVTVYEVRKKRGKRFGHVDLLNKEDLETVMSLQGETIDGREISLYEQKEHFQDKMTKLRSQMVLVKNIEKSVSLEELKELFPDSVRIKYPKTIHGVPKGYAHVKFDSSEKVNEYIQKINDQELKGEKLIVKTMKPAQCASNILLVRNLNFKTKEEDLKKVFPTCTSIKLNVNKFRKSQGHALITMKTIEEAKTVISEKNNITVDNFQLKISLYDIYKGQDEETNKRKRSRQNGVSRKKKISDKGMKKKTKKFMNKQSTKPNTLKPLNNKKTLKPATKSP